MRASKPAYIDGRSDCFEGEMNKVQNGVEVQTIDKFAAILEHRVPGLIGRKIFVGAPMFSSASLLVDRSLRRWCQRV